MANEQPNNPLHGITLEMILNQLVEQYGLNIHRPEGFANSPQGHATGQRLSS